MIDFLTNFIFKTEEIKKYLKEKNGADILEEKKTFNKNDKLFVLREINYSDLKEGDAILNIDENKEGIIFRKHKCKAK